MNESCHTYEWVVSHMNESCYTYGCVMSHIWMSHVTHMNESCHTYKWTSHVTLMDESCHTYERVMSHIRTSHATQEKGKPRGVSTCDMTFSYAWLRKWCDWFIRVTWLIGMCDERGMPHKRKASKTSNNTYVFIYVTHMDQSWPIHINMCHMHEWIVSHIRMSLVTRINQSITYEVTRMKTSCHT